MIVWCTYSLGEGTFMKQGTLDEVVGVFSLAFWDHV
jgi:hypothetical protein